MSGEFIVKDQPAFEGTDVFALPPAAFDTTGTNRRSSKTAAADHLPASPAASPEFMALGRSTNTRQQTSGTKRPLEDFDLPPPPTRTRKIIQMKPKMQQSPSTKSGQASSGRASKDSGKAASSNNANANVAAAPASGNKKKQPTATSAAGRKIARKTAHSLIERRRRSKMNEEFTTLKDMIPACTGQEMHKLAILQVSCSAGFRFDSKTDSKKASIDYVNYLEQCIKDLKTAGGAAPSRLPPGPPSPASPEFLAEMAGSERSASESPEFLPENIQIHDTSPSFSPRTRIPSMSTTYELAPSILPSPALGPSQPEHHPSWPVSTNTSPALQPQQNNANVDHEASAALLMLNQDRRGTLDSIIDKVTDASSESRNSERQETGKRMGMSVRDLLIS